MYFNLAWLSGLDIIADTCFRKAGENGTKIIKKIVFSYRGFPPVLPSANTAIMASLPSYKLVEGGWPNSIDSAWESQSDRILPKS
jgi:hypothetical protein